MQKNKIESLQKRMLTSIRYVLFLPLLFVSACGQGNSLDSGSTLADATESGTAELTVLYVAADGFAYRNEDNELTGVTVEIMRDFVRWFERYHAVSIRLNFEEEANWQTFYQRIVNAKGGVFGLGNVTITQERQQELQFSPAYLNNVAVLITNTSIPELQDWSDFPEQFANLKPMAFAGTLHEERIKQLRNRYQPDATVTAATGNPEIIDAVTNENYYSYIDAYNYWRAIENGAELKHHPIADEVGETFGIIMPHSNDWATMLTAFFAAEGGYRNTEGYREIMQTHLGSALAETLEAARQTN